MQGVTYNWRVLIMEVANKWGEGVCVRTLNHRARVWPDNITVRATGRDPHAAGANSIHPTLTKIIEDRFLGLNDDCSPTPSLATNLPSSRSAHRSRRRSAPRQWRPRLIPTGKWDPSNGQRRSGQRRWGETWTLNSRLARVGIVPWSYTEHVHPPHRL